MFFIGKWQRFRFWVGFACISAEASAVRKSIASKGAGGGFVVQVLESS